MKNDILLIIKGFFIGIAKILPGVSGSLLAISFGVYEKAIEAISCFFKGIKNHIFFLGKLGCGILLAIVLCSNFVLYMLDHFYLPTIFLFVGLISGGIPSLFQKFDLHQKRNKFILFFIFLFVFISFLALKLDTYEFHGKVLDYLYLFFLGLIDAFTMIVPGLSGTLIFLMLGSYSFLMHLFSDAFFLLFHNPFIILFFCLGIFVGIFFTAKMMTFLLKNYSSFIYTIITGFMISSLFLLIVQNIKFMTNIVSFISCFIYSFLGYFIARKME